MAISTFARYDDSFEYAVLRSVGRGGGCGGACAGGKLRLVDARHNDARIEAYVRVYGRANHLMDKDHFVSPNDRTFDLGTPDGSGDIRENCIVWVKICEGSYCSGWNQAGRS